MLPEQQQRIMGYFIEEAKDHLNTIEQGLINLQATIEDSEMVHEVFRAAHSVKGGAAMLGLSSIQLTAHRLEDYFKILKECPSVKTTRKLETLFLRVFDTLHALIDQLQGPFGLTEDKSAELMAAVEPVFAELNQDLSLLVSQSGATLPDDVELDAPVSLPAADTPLNSRLQPVMAQEESAIQLIFQSDIPALLRQMLQLFKQPDNADTREQLQGICQALAQPGEQLDLPYWCDLIERVRGAITHPENSYRMLAPVVIKEVKQAQELVLAGRSIEISPSQSLLELVPSETEWSSAEETETDFSAWFDSSDDTVFATDRSLLELNPEELFIPSAEADTAEQPEFIALQSENEDLLNDLFFSEAIDSPAYSEEAHSEDEAFSRVDDSETESAFQLTGPEVGTAELTSLADLFDADLEAEPADEGDWTEAFDESFDSPLSEMDTVLELGDEPIGFADSLPAFPADDEALTLDENDEDLSALLQVVQLSDLAGSTTEATETALPALENQLFADLEPDTIDAEEALLTSVFSSFDPAEEPADLSFNAPLSPSEAAPEFLELFALEPTDGAIDDAIAPSVELSDVESSNTGNGSAADFDSLFGIDERSEAAVPANAASEFTDSFAFDGAEPLAEDPIATDGFSELFGQDAPPQSSIQPERLPFDTEIATNPWVDAANSSGSSPDSSDFAEGQSDENIAASIESHSTPFEESPEAFPESFDAFSLEQESDDLSAELLTELSDTPPAEFSQEVELTALSDPLDSRTEQTVGNSIADDFDDLEALLAEGETLTPDWNWTAAIEAESLPVSSEASNNSEAMNRPAGEVVEENFVEDEFADLEAMLGEDFDPIAAPLTSQRELFSTAQLEDSNFEDEDEFADLEALLQDAPQDAPPTSPPEVDALPIANLPSSRFTTEDEFGDLEALIKDVDQILGVGSSPARKNTSAASRRPSRRNGLKEQTMRVSVKHLDNLNNLVGEMVVNRNSLEQAQERLRQFLDNLLYQVQQLSDVGQRMRDLYERSLLERSLLSSRRNYSGTGTSSSGSQTSHAIGVSFDALEIDQFSAFHTLSQEMIELIVRVRESASDIDFVVEESDQVTRNFRQITTQLQEGLTRSRMVPFSQTADRLPRGVRDNSLKYGKQAELVIEGRETLIDKMIVEQLSDPMTHIVNNAIAHGIETPEERIAAGKPPTGRITVRAFHQGNQTIISVSDDGAGINPERVKAKALEKGLITPAEANELSRLEIYDLLFHHGFSTVDQADDLRGRGVGLDVVRNNLSEIRGSVTIDSAVGKGTTFTIRLPLTLSISKALCCISNRARIAFPMDGIEDMFDVPKERLQIDDQGRSSIPWRDMVLPLQPLADLLRYSRVLGRGSVYGGNQEDDVISIVVLRSAGTFLALQVDQVLGEQEIVIKQLEGPVPKPIGVAGATVLGDGRIMPIADVLELIDLWQGRIRRESGTTLWERDREPIVEESTKTEPTVLIVDDSITVRELLSMTFSKVGYRVEQARDGQEAWEKLRAGLPCNLVFCDIEMPRMDGLELLSRLQKDANLCELPIAMLTSRGADRHKQMAIQLGAKGYFTKPYLEEVLLDAAQRMLRGEVLVNGNSTSTIN